MTRYIINDRPLAAQVVQLGQLHLAEASVLPYKVADISLDVVSVYVLTIANTNAFVVGELKTSHLLIYYLTYLQTVAPSADVFWLQYTAHSDLNHGGMVR